jgi:hypothetical protein
MHDKKLIMIIILNRYKAKLLIRFSIIITINVCYISCRDSVDLNTTVPTNKPEYTKVTNFFHDSTVNILESKKSGNWIFSKFQKDTLTGLILTCNDSVVFINDMFFSTAKTEYQRFDFTDSLKIEFTAQQSFGNETIEYKYIFCFDNFSNKWLLEYAEKKEFTDKQSVYYFTDCTYSDSLKQNFSMENFSAETSPSALFTSLNKSLFSYRYRKNNYLDSIEIQVNSMKQANVSSFKNIFTVDHAEEILRDYPVHKTNVLFLNNIAYYMEQMSITMPAIAILEAIIADYPDRTVSYLNLSDALSKNNLKVKAEKIYIQYVKQMKAKGKQNEISQRLF